MFWPAQRSQSQDFENFESVQEGLKSVYKNQLLPLENAYHFHDFYSPLLEDEHFEARPMVMLVGQYSSGKTTFIKQFIECEFPGMRIGPEPTTDKFVVLMHNEKDGVVPGNVFAMTHKQFKPLTKFGNAFLNRFQCSHVKTAGLKYVSLVDTPGILSGERKMVDRGYDFIGVLEWFAERVDRIILLFDANKLDISDEFKRSIESLKGHDDKIRIVLNKADMVDHQELMRVYGALMWSLGKVFRTPEVFRVFIGTFWDKPLRCDSNKRLFNDEERDLISDLLSLPNNALLRKLNDLIKRARLAKAHAYIISTLQKEMPYIMKKKEKKIKLIENLDEIYKKVQKEYKISSGDFPDLEKMKESLMNFDFGKFKSLNPHLIKEVNNMFENSVTKLMARIHREKETVLEPMLKVLESNIFYDKEEEEVLGKRPSKFIEKLSEVTKKLGKQVGDTGNSSLIPENVNEVLPIGTSSTLANNDNSTNIAMRLTSVFMSIIVAVLFYIIVIYFEPEHKRYRNEHVLSGFCDFVGIEC